MPNPTDPRAVTDDPSGIVQQMPETAGDVLAPCPFCGAPSEIVHIDEGELAGGSCVTCTRCLACSNVEFEFKENFVSNWNRRATEADLRAEVERLRALAGTAIDQWESFVESDYAGTGMYDGMIADIMGARAALAQGQKEDN